MGFKDFLKTITFDCMETKLKWQFIDKYFSRFALHKLKNKDFSIICNNCVAGGIYHKLGLPYTSPTVGLFFFSEDYINFLENFDYLIKQPLKFRETSVHPTANLLMKKTHRYPVGVLGDKVEIHFLHYKTAAEANDKWNRRIQRLNLNNLFFIYSDGGAAAAGAGDYDFSEDYLARYEKLPFGHKIFFSSKPRAGNCTIFLRYYKNQTQVGNSTCNRKYEKYINLVKWLNGEKYLKKRFGD